MMGLTNFLPGLASSHNPPSLHFPHSCDYRHESPHLASFKKNVYVGKHLHSVKFPILTLSNYAVVWY
jgi:hypothetical protein